jgi:hypothetical protein
LYLCVEGLLCHPAQARDEAAGGRAEVEGGQFPDLAVERLLERMLCLHVCRQGCFPCLCRTLCGLHLFLEGPSFDE